MEAFTRDELLGFLNLMLEAERAGAKALLHVSKDTDRKDASAIPAHPAIRNLPSFGLAD